MGQKSREIILNKSKSKESEHGMSPPKNISCNPSNPYDTLQDSQSEWQFSMKSSLFLNIICWFLCFKCKKTSDFHGICFHRKPISEILCLK